MKVLLLSSALLAVVAGFILLALSLLFGLEPWYALAVFAAAAALAALGLAAQVEELQRDIAELLHRREM